MTTDLILGTAGHIDHGKTSLIRVLTGTNTDRLPEEKKRGITIELGFAELKLDDFRLGIVDVPGHEKFVRNMLAGATGVDMAMLVIAADDSVKQQTREHLEILRLMNLETGLIALTKIDLVDPDWLDLVEEEIRELVADTFLHDAPIIRTSSHTAQGVDELKAALQKAAHKVAHSGRLNRLEAPFRMAIDRTFSVAGHGTVVTGSTSSGEVNRGDELVIQPGNLQVRVRGLQNHDRSVEQVHHGQRAAISLAGVHHDEIQRGHELALAGYLEPSRLMTVRVMMLESAPRPLKNRSHVRFHIGTAEVMASVVLLDRPQLERGETASAQLFLSEPTVATWNQPFVLRSESPVITIGGGHILVPNARKLRRPEDDDFAMLDWLSSNDPLKRASAAIFFEGLQPWAPGDLARTAGIVKPDDIYAQLIESGDVREIQVTPTRTARIHQKVIAQICERIEAALRTIHDQHPLKTTLERSRVMHGFEYVGDQVVITAILEEMKARGQIRLTAKGVALVGCGPKLSKSERNVLNDLIQQYRNLKIETPTVAELQKKAVKNQNSVPQLIELAAADGDLVAINSTYYLHRETFSQICHTLAEQLQDGRGRTLSEIREILDTTRKFAVPLCEFLDEIGFTKRQGDLRQLGDRHAVSELIE